MSGLDLKKLKQNKDEILKAEIASYLMLWDKVDPDKINKASINVPYKKLSCWKNDLKSCQINFKDENKNIIKSFKLWDNFLNGWRSWRGKNKSDDLLQILYGISESLNSGIDKGAPKEDIKVKPENERWLANAFGSFKRKIIYLEKSEQEINHIIDTIKNEITKLLNQSIISDSDITKVRKNLKLLLDGLLSDDRFPINDVSLWDQTYLPASMFKALVAERVLKGDFSNIPDRQKVKWRILGIQYDKLGLAEKGFKLASIQWYRETVKKIDDEIKNLLELEYPIGNEIYRDETGIYFIVGEDLGKDNGDFAELDDGVKDLENEIIKIFENNLQNEDYPIILLTKASRGLMNLGYLLEKAKENFLKKKNIKLPNLEINDKNKGIAIGICPLCKIRLIYEKDKQKNNSPTICEVCDDRIHHQKVKNWMINLGSETIWTSEIKDKNDRIALISLKFELRDWLNGNMLNSLVLQSDLNFNDDLQDLKKQLNEIFKNGNDMEVGKTILKKYTDETLHKRKIKENKIIESILLERSIGDKWEEFIKNSLSNPNLIDFEKRIISWNQLKDSDIELLATLLLQFLLRKNPSPARLRRIWETTQEFFEEIKKDILYENKLGIPDWRRKRLVFEVDYKDEYKIKPTGEELEGNGLLFWAQPQTDENNKINKLQIYLITSIEDFIEKYGKKDVIEKIKNDQSIQLNKESFQKFEIKLRKYIESKDEEQKAENNNEEKNVIITENNIIELQEYKPYASITDPTPVGWQVIIPAMYVSNFIDLVMEKYNEKFKYVYGKLPIHIGVIFQDYKKPLYIGINALRRIRRDVKNIDKLYIDESFLSFCLKQKEKLDKATPEEKVNDTEKYYSLYWNNSNNQDYNFYIKPDSNWKKWISTLDKFNQNDKINIIPNTFDFEFLDSNTRRNDIFYDENNHYKRAFELKSNRPYEIEVYWEKFKIFRVLFKEKVSSSKLEKLVYLFYGKLENYEQNYNYLLASSIVNILELRKNQEAQKLIAKIFDLENDKDILQELAVKLDEEKIKLFLDMFQFWHKALKEV